VPTCSCPANVNVKDCCAGIMCALSQAPAQKERFIGWFGKNWFKRELLDRRHRADCDPFLYIAETWNKPVKVEAASTSSFQDLEASAKLVSPTSVIDKFKSAVDQAGVEQFIVRCPPFF